MSFQRSTSFNFTGRAGRVAVCSEQGRRVCRTTLVQLQSKRQTNRQQPTVARIAFELLKNPLPRVERVKSISVTRQGWQSRARDSTPSAWPAATLQPKCSARTKSTILAWISGRSGFGIAPRRPKMAGGQPSTLLTLQCVSQSPRASSLSDACINKFKLHPSIVRQGVVECALLLFSFGTVFFFVAFTHLP